MTPKNKTYTFLKEKIKLILTCIWILYWEILCIGHLSFSSILCS